MTTLLKIFACIMDGRRDNNISFSDLQRLLDSLGFQHRVKGDHFIYWHDDVEEIINIQPNGSNAKAYQVKQVRNIILRYELKIYALEEKSLDKYEKIIYWSEADNRFIVEVPELPGCMADGETEMEALKNVSRVISEWIETAEMIGRDVPVPSGKLMYA